MFFRFDCCFVFLLLFTFLHLFTMTVNDIVLVFEFENSIIRKEETCRKLFSGCRHESINLCDIPFTLIDLHEHYSHQPSCWTLMSGEEFRGRRRRSEEPHFKEPQFKEPQFKEPQFKELQFKWPQFKLIRCMRQTQKL